MAPPRAGRRHLPASLPDSSIAVESQRPAVPLPAGGDEGGEKRGGRYGDHPPRVEISTSLTSEPTAIWMTGMGRTLQKGGGRPPSVRLRLLAGRRGGPGRTRG